jgi:hypothetical protein
MTKNLIDTLLTLSNLGKQEVQDLQDELIAEIENGEVSPLRLYVGLTILDKVRDTKAGDLIKPYAIAESETYEKSFFIGNCEVEKGNHTTYDFSNDIIWNKIKSRETEISEQRKNREKILKACPQPDSIKGVEAMTEVDTETGEVIRLLPPTKKSSELLKIKII